MTDDQKQMLTEKLLDECWHYPEAESNLFRCKKCNTIFWQVTIKDRDAFNRTFTTWQDVGDCKDKLVEKGLWNEFDEWAFMKWDALKPFNDLSRHIGEFNNWLFLPVDESGEPHFCRLVAEFLRE